MRLNGLLFLFFFHIASCGLLAQQAKIDTLTFVSPSQVNIDSAMLYSGVDSIITEALDSGAFPGCQILLAKDGQIFYYKSFGYHTYDSLQTVRNSDLYDLASITKITATTLALMKLYDEGLFDLDQTLDYYFPFLAKSNKSDLSIRKVLAHQSRLKNWIPYYSESQRRNGKYKRKTISADSSARFPNRIPGSDLFLHKDFKEDKIYKMIKKSDLYEEEGYVYSGLAFYLFPELIVRLSEVPFEQYLEDNFYEPLGANSLGFDPLKKYDLNQIVPSEVDTFFRMNKLHGVVHDEGAAVMLGISGNAGLFSNAEDLAKVHQMLLNGGTYKGNQYLNPETINEFTRCQYCDKNNRRGLGFDKPLVEYDSIKTSVAKLASPNSYGHSGYTGTLVWADPDNQLLFIFLANRVYPSRTNRKIYQLNIRPRIHDLVYGLIEKQ
ncbi:serine hydrolase domain-containing protein [Reichenbachiella sp.]|uniref:serine hydrolase domain-containing protein n=1 Tax=Reichenbachiella sp. TaxID=2184521 RepID=UPI003B5ABF47